MDFHDFPMILGKSGCVSHPPPQVVCTPTQDGPEPAGGPEGRSGGAWARAEGPPPGVAGVSKIVLLTLYSVKKCLIHSL